MDKTLSVQVVAGVRDGRHDDTVLKPLVVPLTVAGLQGVGLKKLQSANKSLKSELKGISLLEQILELVEGVPFNDLLVPQAFANQVFGLLLKGVKEHHVLVDVLQEVCSCSLRVLVELDQAVLVVNVEGGV